MEKITAGRRIGTGEGVTFLMGCPTSKELKEVRSEASSCLGEESSRQRGLRCIGPKAGKGKRIGGTAVWLGKSEQGRVEEMKVER